MGVELGKKSRNICIGKIDFMIMSEVSTDGNTNKNDANQYWSHLKLKLDKANEILPSTCRIGKFFYLNGCNW